MQKSNDLKKENERIIEEHKQEIENIKLSLKSENIRLQDKLNKVDQEFKLFKEKSKNNEKKYLNEIIFLKSTTKEKIVSGKNVIEANKINKVEYSNNMFIYTKLFIVILIGCFSLFLIFNLK